MDLAHFENHIPHEILKQGQQYLAGGCLMEISPTGVGYEVEVTGSEPYVVAIGMDKDRSIILADCTCDERPYCKHKVAALYMLKERYN